MGPKAILFLCLLAVVLMIASDVTARDLAENNKASDRSTNGLKESKYPGGGYEGYPGGGYGGRGGYGSSGYCRYSCCGRNYYGRGCRCCSDIGEAVDARPETKPQN